MIVKFAAKGIVFAMDIDSAENLCAFLNVYRREKTVAADPAIWAAVEKVYDDTNVNRHDRSTMWERHLVNIVDRMIERDGFDKDFFRKGAR